MPSTKVEVYYNLHKHCLSVRCKGIVVMHVQTIWLKNVKFKVRENGRQRVLRERKKNVHAWIEGEIDLCPNKSQVLRGHAKYNPYLNKTFVCPETGLPVRSATKALIEGKTIRYTTL